MEHSVKESIFHESFFALNSMLLALCSLLSFEESDVGDF